MKQMIMMPYYNEKKHFSVLFRGGYKLKFGILSLGYHILVQDHPMFFLPESG